MKIGNKYKTTLKLRNDKLKTPKSTNLLIVIIVSLLNTLLFKRTHLNTKYKARYQEA